MDLLDGLIKEKIKDKVYKFNLKEQACHYNNFQRFLGDNYEQ